ncbi:MAG: pyridoxamine 5'-phosphate oxidase family protein [Acidimicrobiales bacterium]
MPGSPPPDPAPSGALPEPPSTDACWPEELDELFRRAVTAEYSSITRSGSPVTVPTTPYVSPDGRTLDVSTGLTYPAKAERARRNPKVSLLYADPVGSGLEDPPVVLVQGLAAVRDADLQANTDRYVSVSMAKLPEATKGKPSFALRRMAWYFARIWIEVTPLHIYWWPDRSQDVAPREWHAPEGATSPPSDPPPPGVQPPAWLAPPPSWEPLAADAMTRMAMADLTVVSTDGFPACLPVTVTSMDLDGLRLEIGSGAVGVEGSSGAACLTFHHHPEAFTGQENRTFVGKLAAAGEPRAFHFEVERALADWSLSGGTATVALGFLAKGRKLRPRLAAEASRRGQPVPKVHLSRTSRRA